MPKLASKSALIVVGLTGLAAYHVATGQYSLAINDALTFVAATHSAPVLKFLGALGIPVPADPLTPAAPAAGVVVVSAGPTLSDPSPSTR